MFTITITTIKKHNNIMGKRVRHFVGNNYDDVKIRFMNAWKSDIPFDDDVFHDTIIKCIEKENEPETDDEILKYMYESFKRNMLREQMYHRNSRRDFTADVFKSGEEYYEDKCTELSSVLDLLYKEFGTKIIDMYIEWRCCGFTIEEIEAKHRISNVPYKFKKIKDFLKTLDD